MRKVLLAVVALLALVGCGSADARPVALASASSITHVVMILEENHNITTVTSNSMPYLTGLGNKYAKATNLNAITHPSLPNYFALTGGSTFGHTNDCGSSITGCTVAADNIYHQSGSAWSQLSESMKGNCESHNSTPYVVHHAPAPYYNDVRSTTCPTNDVPLDKINVPTVSAKFTFITPNLNDDAHDGSLGAADNWLQTVVPQLLQQSSFTNGSMLIEITFDEGSSGNNKVYTAYLQNGLNGVTVTKAATHYSTLRLNEELLGYPLLKSAASAPDLRAALGL